MKYLFCDDYSDGAHPAVLDFLAKHNDGQQTGYGLDEYSDLAAKRILEQLRVDDAEVHFVSGGTQANIIALASMLLPYQAVIAPQTGHINVHEAGAIEAIGHKILACQSEDGKLKPSDIVKVVEEHSDEHQVQPKVVYLTQATETGTAYTKSELEVLITTANNYGLYTYLDGARLAVAMASDDSKMSFVELGKLGLDMFYIGGTKNGALAGEAVIICNPELKTNFRYYIKQRGGLLAKGRFLGLQFARLFEDNLWLELGKTSNQITVKLASELEQLRIKLAYKQQTNQIFPIFPNKVIDELQKKYGFYVWQRLDDDTSVTRMVCSWATKEEDVQEFVAELKSIKRT